MADPRRKAGTVKRRSSGGRRTVSADEEAVKIEISSEEPEAVSGEQAAEPEQSAEAEQNGEAEKSEEKDELLERYQRLAAEFDNYRKRQARDFNRLIDQGRKKLVSELLVVLDNFDRARTTAQGDHSDKEIVDGIMQTSDQLVSILRKEGLEEIVTEPGDAFDPNLHEAMFAEDLEEGETDIVLEVYQKAYRFGQDLLRPARVKVGRAAARNGG
ncbi:nucleotide exchange factor GrpE [Candidatus Fermentibacteria bacterium]|nr:MAG: nucleotide exchange factor GrpE [Candidatus Fermentibacteria bacterium]